MPRPMSYPRITTKASRAIMNQTTAYPFPTVARIALSLYASTRKIESLPRVTVYEPHDFVMIVRQVRIQARGTEETL